MSTVRKNWNRCCTGSRALFVDNTHKRAYCELRKRKTSAERAQLPLPPKVQGSGQTGPEFETLRRKDRQKTCNALESRCSDADCVVTDRAFWYRTPRTEGENPVYAGLISQVSGQGISVSRRSYAHAPNKSV